MQFISGKTPGIGLSVSSEWYSEEAHEDANMRADCVKGSIGEGPKAHKWRRLRAASSTGGLRVSQAPPR